MKTHYMVKEQETNESTSFEIWQENTLCGIKHFEGDVTDKPKEVDCKKCLKIIHMYKEKSQTGIRKIINKFTVVQNVFGGVGRIFDLDELETELQKYVNNKVAEARIIEICNK